MSKNKDEAAKNEIANVGEETKAMSIVNLGGTLDISDIITVATSRAEGKFHKELAASKVRLKVAEADVERSEKDASKLYRSECKAAANGMADLLRPVIESVGGKVTVNSKCQYTAQRRDRDKDGNLTQDITIRNNTDGCHSCTTRFVAKAQPSEALVALEAEIVVVKKDVAAEQMVALGWRKKLSNIPMLERSTRAKLAEAKMAETGEGQDLLALLTDDLDVMINNLPGV